ncbi:hypothetical protein CLOM_g10372 [Closterium sp. NIES-68]|nr:hypothetical protein CLOM_g10372 [Closterium sp. NIES-68]GJP80638.1 hypothetical protein CLOP_g10839 [Closterium sp. NIES-67]
MADSAHTATTSARPESLAAALFSMDDLPFPLPADPPAPSLRTIAACNALPTLHPSLHSSSPLPEINPERAARAVVVAATNGGASKPNLPQRRSSFEWQLALERECSQALTPAEGASTWDGLCEALQGTPTLCFKEASTEGRSASREAKDERDTALCSGRGAVVRPAEGTGGEMQIKRMLAALSQLASCVTQKATFETSQDKLLSRGKAPQEPYHLDSVYQLGTVVPDKSEPCIMANEANLPSNEDTPSACDQLVQVAAAAAKAEKAVLASTVAARAQMGRGNEEERQQLMALLQALKHIEERQEQPQQAQQGQQRQAWQAQVQHAEGEEHHCSSHWAVADAEVQPELVKNELALNYAPHYTPDGALRSAHSAGAWARMGKRGGEGSCSGGCVNGGAERSGSPESAVGSRGISSNVSCGIKPWDADGISSSILSAGGTSAATASGAGRKRKSPEWNSGCATAAHEWQHRRQVPHGCYSPSVLGPTAAPPIQSKPASALFMRSYPAAAPPMQCIPATAGRAVVPASVAGLTGAFEAMCSKDVDSWPCDTDLGFEVEAMRSAQLQPECAEEDPCASAREDWCGVADEWQMRDECGLKNESETKGECENDEEWMPRCQGARSGSGVRSLRIKSRSMAERRRRERISEGLKRLRVKVRGRGDTCAMLDRAVRYVDVLERRVGQLESYVLAARSDSATAAAGNRMGRFFSATGPQLPSRFFAIAAAGRHTVGAAGGGGVTAANDESNAVVGLAGNNMGWLGQCGKAAMPTSFPFGF